MCHGLISLPLQSDHCPGSHSLLVPPLDVSAFISKVILERSLRNADLRWTVGDFRGCDS